MLHAAVIGKGINVLHEAAQAWLNRKATEKTKTPTLPPIANAPDVTEDPTPETSAASAADLEASLEPWRAKVDLESLVEPLSTLTERYGSAKEFSDWVKCRKTLEEALRAQMLRERVAGRLVARTTVQRMIEKVDDAFRLMLADAPRKIATQIAPNDLARCTVVVREAMVQILDKGKDAMLKSLEADDPLSPLLEAAE